MLTQKSKVAPPRHFISHALIALAPLYLVFAFYAVYTARAQSTTEEGGWRTYQTESGQWVKERVSYLLPDHLGSTDAVVTEAGEVVERQDYLPYGAERLRISAEGVAHYTGAEAGVGTTLAVPVDGNVWKALVRVNVVYLPAMGGHVAGGVEMKDQVALLVDVAGGMPLRF